MNGLRGQIPLAIIAGLALVVMLTSVWMGVLGHASTPIWDQWDQLVPQQLSGHFFDVHNEHRIALSRATLWLDIALARDTGVVATAFVYIFSFAQLALVVVLSRRTWPDAPLDRIALAAAMSATFLLSGFQFENFLSGFQNQFTGVFLFGSLAIVAMANGLTRTGREKIAALVVSAVAAVIATAAMANGLIVVLILPVMAAAVRRVPVAALFAVLAVVLILLFFHDYPAASGQGLISKFATNPVGILLGVLEYLGGALPNSLSALLGASAPKLALARVFGVIALIGVGLIARDTLRDPGNIRPWKLAWLGIAVFVLASAVVTAAGRVDMAEYAMLSNRYGAPSGVLWSVLATWGIVATTGGVRRRWIVLAASLAACGLLAIAQYAWIGGTQVYKYRKMDAEAALLSGADVPAIYREVYPDPARPPTIARSLRELKLATFADPWSRLVGSEVVAPEAKACGSEILSVQSVVGPVAPTWRTTVTGSFPGSTRAIAVAGASGKVSGLLIRGMTGDRASEAFGFRHPPAKWSGFVLADPSGEVARLAGYAVDREGRAVCKLDKPISIDPAQRIRIAPANIIGQPLASDMKIAIDGVFPMGGENDAVKPSPYAGRTWGSWGGADANTGRLELAFDAGGAMRIALPVVTGPRTESTKLEVRVDSQRILELSAPQGLQAWQVLTLNIPGGARRIELVAEDNSKDWGGWIAIGEPRTICAGACVGAPLACPSKIDVDRMKRTGMGGALDVVRPDGGQMTLIGWAADFQGRQPTAQVVVLVNGKVAGCGQPAISRPDVSAAYGATSYEYSGFSVTVAGKPTQKIELFSRQVDGALLPLNTPNTR